MKRLISVSLALLLLLIIPCKAFAAQSYSTMTDEELQAMIDNASAELASRNQEKEEQPNKTDLIKSLCGDWVELYGRWEKDPNGTYGGWIWKPQGDYSFSLFEDGSLKLGSSVGSWQLSENGDQIIADTGLKTSWSIVEDDGVIKLQTNNAEKTLVKQETYADLAEEMFLVVTVDKDNISEYIKALDAIELKNEWGDKVGLRVRFRNNIFEDGFVYIGHSNDYMNEYTVRTESGNQWYTINWPFGSCGIQGENSLEFVCFGRAKGTITFANPDFIAKNYIDEDGHRTIEFKDGAKIVFEMSDWTPEEYQEDMY